MIFGTPPIVTQGLVLHLDAGNRMSYIGSGTTWSDLSGNNVNGTLTNGPTFNTTYGGGITFDGTNDYASLGNNTVTQFPNNSPWSFSITAQLLSQNTAYAGIFVKGQSYISGSGSGILLFYVNSGSVCIKQNNSQPTTVEVSMNTPFQYTATYAGENQAVRVYLNGRYRNNGAVIGSYDASSDFQLGNGDSYGNTQIFNFLKYNRQLSDAEVAQNYNAIKNRFGFS